jgi:CDP-4-dehydro-6-deoxyglucose reductase, E1
MKYSLASDTWGIEEKNAIQRVIDSNRYTMGAEVAAFEEEFAKYIGSKYAVMVNSGSSANLLSIAALRYSNNYDLQPGDEVIVPAVSWSTTYFPLHQYGLIPVFVDIDSATLNIDTKEVEKAITPKTKAVLAVNLLGNPCDLLPLQKLCKSENLILIEDNCESFGAKYKGKFTGTFGTVGTFSFFFSHHLQTMEGGMIITDDEEIAQSCKSLRAHGWIRDLPEENWIHSKSGNAFEDSFKFILPGYSVRPLEMSGAIGREQLKKADLFIENRRENAKTFKDLMGLDSRWMLQEEIGESTWFGFAILLLSRDKVIPELMKKGIECRPIVAGDFTKNPVIKFMEHRIVGSLPSTNLIDKCGFFVGNDSSNLAKEITYLHSIMNKIVK